MEVSSDQVEIIEEIDEEVYSGEEVSFHDPEIKTEVHDEENIKNEGFEVRNNSEHLKIIGEKRKNQETANSENKKIKEEFVVFEESDYKQEPQEIEEIHLSDLNTQVSYTNQYERGSCRNNRGQHQQKFFCV